MARTSLAYDKPSRVSQVLILGFGAAVVLMVGWLAFMFVASRNGTVADSTTSQDVPSPDTVVVAPPIQHGPPAISASQLSSQGMLSGVPVAWPAAPGGSVADTATMPSVAAAPVAAAAPGSTSAPDAAPFATSSLPASASEAGDRGVPSEDLTATADATAEAIEFVPIPVPRPRHISVIPVPRPRPRIDEPAEAPAPAERSLFDFLIDRSK